mgnify:FL=1|tara:strand:- start:144 stop:368 length:225 start_codon:yes stop_codon:yes gene_type:complete
METWIHNMLVEHDYDAVDVAEYKFYVEQVNARNERHIAHTFSMSPKDYEQPLSFEDWQLSRLSNPTKSWYDPSL